MNAGELLKKVTRQDRTGKILKILKESKNPEEAIEKTKALLNR